jgi:hypothetical protein
VNDWYISARAWFKLPTFNLKCTAYLYTGRCTLNFGHVVF